MPPASASRCPSTRSGRRWLLRANVLAKGFSGVRARHARAAGRVSERARAPAHPVARIGRRQRRPRPARAPGARAHRRRATRSTAGRSPSAGLAAADSSRPRKASRSSTARSRRRRSSRWPRHDATRLADAADIAAAMSIDALRGSAKPFDPRIHDGRPFEGQRLSAAPASPRCWPTARSIARTPTAAACRTRTACAARPQVHGAARDALALRRPHAGDRDERRHRQPDGLRRRERRASSRAATSTARRSRIAADLLAIAVTHLATISERRSDRLLNADISGLPPFLIARQRPALRADDGAGHGGRARLGAQERSRIRPASTPSRRRPARKITSA